MTYPTMTPELRETLRQKAREGALTLEEQRMAIAALREDRVRATTVSAKSRATKAEAKAKQAPIDCADLLSQLQ
jgi:hypothetical protein